MKHTQVAAGQYLSLGLLCTADARLAAAAAILWVLPVARGSCLIVSSIHD